MENYQDRVLDDILRTVSTLPPAFVLLADVTDQAMDLARDTNRKVTEIMTAMDNLTKACGDIATSVSDIATSQKDLAARLMRNTDDPTVVQAIAEKLEQQAVNLESTAQALNGLAPDPTPAPVTPQTTSPEPASPSTQEPVVPIISVM